ncbi:hypothetical protein LMTR13_19570 [Bradyrhizobium icense]|uniref:Uncharacterized protein n=1 Tax=Bradyrhizobium icense TaxID=1274631 RepID=A0A1B1UH09_9BRAD|nr:hypothetical protein LMTR13_19570 [Bradyrhizobium icense]
MLLTTAAKNFSRKQSVDDSHAALEIVSRSSYVPTFNQRRLIPVLARQCAPNAARASCAWKCRYG